MQFKVSKRKCEILFEYSRLVNTWSKNVSVADSLNSGFNERPFGKNGSRQNTAMSKFYNDVIPVLFYSSKDLLVSYVNIFPINRSN